MLSPLKPLLCRHDFYWSERHQADRCRGCGKTQPAHGPDAFETSGGPQSESMRAAESEAVFIAEAAAGRSTELDFLAVPQAGRAGPAPGRPDGWRASAKVLKAEALERRENLAVLLDRIVDGAQLTRHETLDALLALIEDGHSAEPVLFGAGAAGHFARLHQARRDLAL